MEDCDGALHPKAIEGLKLFNEKKFFETHEELEEAWRAEKGDIRDLYQGILQIAVTYLHITRGNYDGAIKVYDRSVKLLNRWPEVCRGVALGRLRKDASVVIREVERLGAENISRFNTQLFKPILWNEKRIWICDRCGVQMHEKNCKVSCPNCGNRFDCSDLNIYFD
jgi:predicted metal-dependent hydrolase